MSQALLALVGISLMAIFPELVGPVLAFSTVFFPACFCYYVSRWLVRRFCRWLGWWKVKTVSSKKVLGIAAAMEQRPSRRDNGDLLRALECEGEIADDLHEELAEAAYYERKGYESRHFYRHWIAAVRMEFPLRSSRPSDKACMTKWLVGKMRAKGIRITHIEDAVPRIVAMAINPSRAEVEAEEMAEVADDWRTPASRTWMQWALGISRDPISVRKWE